MPSHFDEIDAAGQAAIAEFLSEGIDLVGMIGGEYSHAPDPARPVQSSVGVPSVAPATGDLRGRTRGSEISGASQIATGSCEMWMAAEAVAALVWVPRRGDVVILKHRAGLPRFFITAAFPGDFGDLQILMAFASATTGAA